MKVNKGKGGERAPAASGNIMIKLAAVLLCLVLFSTHFMGGLYARYTASGKGDDSARVAAFKVDVSGSSQLVTVTTAANKGTYTITVNNDSEVAVAYSLSVAAPDTLNFDVKVNDKTLGNGNTTADFGQVGSLAPGSGQSGSFDLSFSVADWDTITKDAAGGLNCTFEAMPFTVTVDVVQID